MRVIATIVNCSLFIAVSIATVSSSGPAISQTSADLDNIVKSRQCPANLGKYDWPKNNCEKIDATTPWEKMLEITACDNQWYRLHDSVARYNKFVQKCQQVGQQKISPEQNNSASSKEMDLSKQLDSATEGARGAAQQNAASLDQLNKDFETATTEKSSEYLRLVEERRQIEEEMRRIEEYRAQLRAQMEYEKRRRFYQKLEQQRRRAEADYYRKLQQRQQVMQLMNNALGAMNSFNSGQGYQPGYRPAPSSTGSGTRSTCVGTSCAIR